MIRFFVEEPDGGIVGIGHGVGGHKALSVSLAQGNDTGHGSGWPQVKLQPLMI